MPSAAAGSNPFAADFDGQRLVIRAKSSAITAFSIVAANTDSTVTDLKLSDIVPDGSVAADRADLLIHTQDGTVYRYPWTESRLSWRY